MHTLTQGGIILSLVMLITPIMGNNSCTGHTLQVVWNYEGDVFVHSSKLNQLRFFQIQTELANLPNLPNFLAKLG